MRVFDRSYPDEKIRTEDSGPEELPEDRRHPEHRLGQVSLRAARDIPFKRLTASLHSAVSTEEAITRVKGSGSEIDDERYNHLLNLA